MLHRCRGVVVSEVSVATTATTTDDYLDDKVPLPPAIPDRPVRTLAIQGSPRVRGACG